MRTYLLLAALLLSVAAVHAETGNTTGNICSADATIFVKEFYPKGGEYVFVCDESEEFVPIAYVWDFGDGQHVAGPNEIFHNYTQPGNYTVYCVATDAKEAAFAERSLVVTVGDLGDGETPGNQSNNQTGNNQTDGNQTDCGAEATIFIREFYPKGSEYVFICDEFDEFTPFAFVWDFGDGEHLAGPNEVYHKYLAAGEYIVRCAGTDAKQVAFGERTVLVSEADVGRTVAGNQSNETNVSATIAIAPYYPQDGKYVFTCSADGFAASSYDWLFGDGQMLLGVLNGNVFHEYHEAGSHDLTCIARGEGKSATGTLTVNVSLAPAADLTGEPAGLLDLQLEVVKG